MCTKINPKGISQIYLIFLQNKMMCLKQWKIISLNGSVVFEFLSFNKHQLLGPEANSKNLPKRPGVCVQK